MADILFLSLLRVNIESLFGSVEKVQKYILYFHKTI